MNATAADLQAKLRAACTQLGASFAVALEANRKAIRTIDACSKQFADQVIQRETRVQESRVAQVRALVRSGRLDALTAMQAKVAARDWGYLRTEDIRRVFERFPNARAAFAKEVLRLWDAFQEVSHLAGLVTLLAQTPAEAMGVIRIAGSHLARPDAPQAFAMVDLGKDPQAALRTLHEGYGFHPGWAFTALVLAHWLRRQRFGFDVIWAVLQHDLQLETMLLPPQPEESRSWFSDARRPPRIRSCPEARALTVAWLLRSGALVRSPGYWSFIELLLKSSFGDPRTPPESEGWRRIRELDAEAYDRLIEELVSEDIEVFFEHAYGSGGDPARKRFWRGYLRSIRRTLCILDPPVYERLRAKLSGSDERFRAALARAHRFRRRSDDGQAFCLYFDRYVLVEFSKTNNAAYVYERSVFEREIEPAIRNGKLEEVSDLKRKLLATDRISHVRNWQQSAMETLYRLGIYMDQRLHRGGRERR